MAVAPTGAIYKAFKFDGVSSRNYGIYITGSAVYNAPERDVEMVSIPGRDGAFALDNGRFENIEITYTAGVFADNETDFANAISDFRNFLCSKKGYVRLEDEYNPNEYRMAIYKSGLDVSPFMLKAGEFDITFECMPQRWLKSGEQTYTITSGSPLTNPTYFDSRPMLMVNGYGNIGINNSNISITYEALGTVQLSAAASGTTATLSSNLLASGDRIYETESALPSATITIETNASIQATVGELTNINWQSVTVPSSRILRMSASPTLPDFNYGTASTVTSKVKAVLSGGISRTLTFTITTTYDGASTITIGCTVSNLSSDMHIRSQSYSHPSYYGDSTKSVLPDPVYIDLDIGEAYGEVGGEMSSLDTMVSLPAELPVLQPGANTITFPNTVTSFKVVPRWWKI